MTFTQEESPSCCKTVFHLTNGRINTRESATENKLLFICHISEQSPDILSLATKALKYKNAVGILIAFCEQKVVKVKRWCKRLPVFMVTFRACKPNMAARNRRLASYKAIVSLEVLCK